jgi:predicted DNA-binding transcriptional regulator AlpA
MSHHDTALNTRGGDNTQSSSAPMPAAARRARPGARAGREAHNIDRGAASIDEFLTIQDILEELRVSRSTWDQWLALDRTPTIIELPNRSLRVRRADYEQWLKALERERKAA